LLGAVVIVAGVLVGISAFSSAPLPVLAASYKCVPGALIPQLNPGQSATLTASYGGFTATFHSTMPAMASVNGPDVGMPFKGALELTRGGQHWNLPPAATTKDSQINAMCVIAFQREQYPGVMIEGFTGGAHCCEVPVLYRYSTTQNTYVKVLDMSAKHYRDPHAFDGDGGFIPKVVGNQVLLTTGDERFGYAFGCYACSTDPIVLDTVGARGLTDVTAKYPSLVAADASTIWTIAQKALKAESPPSASSPFSQAYSPFGFLAPWVADECVLKNGSTAWSTILQLQREGKLSTALYDQWTLNHDTFVADLHAFLLRSDYCTGQI
jgi:hypothetical protein